MAKGVNKVIIVGNLGAMPEIRYMPNGAPVTTISVATTEQWRDKSTGAAQERTEWHRVTFFGKLAEIAGEYLKKGRQVYIEGSLRTDRYNDRNGVERYSTSIVASEMQMLGASSSAERSAPTERAEDLLPARPEPTGAGGIVAADDIPFAAAVSRRSWSALS